jgi:glycosyltransferase involved in cell wall biosynthesis
VLKVEPQFEFYFAGRNMPEEFKNIDIKGVHCMDEVPDADAFISDKKILIVPLRSGGGIRVKILEAMAAGKIVITTGVGIKGIEAKPGEHYLRAHKAEDFVKAIKWCLDNKGKAEMLANNARKLIADKYDHRSIMLGIGEKLEGMIMKQHEA